MSPEIKKKIKNLAEQLTGVASELAQEIDKKWESLRGSTNKEEKDNYYTFRKECSAQMEQRMRDIFNKWLSSL